MGVEKAVLLAAGVGQRLGKDHPKCLLRFAEQSLLERHIANLGRLGITRVIVVVGFQADRIQDELASASIEVRCIPNPDYRRGSVLSLLAAKDELERGDDLLLMDADVLYDFSILERLMATSIANCFLLDRDLPPGDEPVKLCVRDGILVEFSKHPRPGVVYDFAGESVGFFRFSGDVAARLAERTASYAENGKADSPYEDAIRDLLLAQPYDFGFEDITDLPWIEIDFPEDIARAENDILPRLESRHE